MGGTLHVLYSSSSVFNKVALKKKKKKKNKKKKKKMKGNDEPSGEGVKFSPLDEF